MALPRRSESLRGLPSSASSSKSGARLPTSCPLPRPLARLLRAIRMPANNMAATMAATKNRTKGFLFTSNLSLLTSNSAGAVRSERSLCLYSWMHIPLQRKAVQEREVAGDESKATHHQQDAENNEQTSARYFHRVHMEFEAVIELQKSL